MECISNGKDMSECLDKITKVGSREVREDIWCVLWARLEEAFASPFYVMYVLAVYMQYHNMGLCFRSTLCMTAKWDHWRLLAP